MAVNPFIDDFPVDNIEDWIGSEEPLETLRYKVKKRTNTCILGPEGSGKTSLLRTAFSLDFRREMARRKKLIFFADLTNRDDSDELCDYLADSFENEVSLLVKDPDVLNRIRTIVKKQSHLHGKTRFQNISQNIHLEDNYILVIVMDAFERFLMSPTVTQDHHECLRSLIEGGCIQCVAATNYDLTKDSLPDHIRGSYLIQKFTNYIYTLPFAEEDVRRFLERKQDGVPVLIRGSMAGMIHQLTGGIPGFVNILSKRLYAAIIEAGRQGAPGDPVTAARQDCNILMSNWCKLLTDLQIKAMEMLLSGYSEKYCIENYGSYDFTGRTELEPAVSLLLERGLFRKHPVKDKNGVIRERDYLVRFNSLLFQRFCKEGQMRPASQRNPLAGLVPGPGTLAGLVPDPRIVQPAGNGVHIDNVYIQGPETVSFNNVTINQGISAKEFLQLLIDSGSQEEFGLLIGQRLREHIQSRLDCEGIRKALSAASSDDAAYDTNVDQAFSEAGRKLFGEVEVDEYEDIIDVQGTELQTLDERFETARKKIHSDLTDELLEEQSERCQFYLKMAVVVEEALSIPGIRFEDYSAQLILYGKAIEQALKDNFYALFHGVGELAEYSLGTHACLPDAKDNFGHFRQEKTFIGNYAQLIGDRKRCLARLCADASFRLLPGEPPADWVVWWGLFARDVDTVRRIRNLAGHAGPESPDVEKLREMYEIMIGSSSRPGIISRSLAGRDLYSHHIAPEETPEEMMQLVGQCVAMRCTEVKTNGGIRGQLADKGYTVSISGRKVQKYKERNTSFAVVESIRLEVKLLELKHENNMDYFDAEIMRLL